MGNNIYAYSHAKALEGSIKTVTFRARQDGGGDGSTSSLWNLPS